VDQARSAVDIRPAPWAPVRRTRRSVSKAEPKARHGTERARPDFSVSGACAARRQGAFTRTGGDATAPDDRGLVD
jgi:hypothetical protein